MPRRLALLALAVLLALVPVAFANHIRGHGGSGNDAMSAHYGRGTIDCGPGRDIYHVPKSRRRLYEVRNCEKVDRRSERRRGGGLKPLR